MSQVNHSRKTIGVLLDAGYYIESFNALYWPGAADFAQDHGINLIVFVGRSATTFYGEAEYMYNISTKFISPDIVDGLVILSGSLADGMGIEGVRDVCKQYESIPKVCISLPIDDVPCVMIDNKAGFEELLTHLITIHDYKRIAFLKGTPKTYDAEERFDVYCKTLEKFNIPIDDELIVHGEFSYESGVDAVNILIEQRNVLFDVLVCSDDDSALGALDEFKRLGIHVPDDVAITGFDNINEVQYITPPLTTVTQPFYEQSKKACELVLAMIHGEGVPKRTYLSTELVLRQSCGCFSDSILELKPIVSCETSYSEIAQKIVTAKSSVIELVLAKFTEETIISKNLNRWLEKLYDALVENFKDFNDNYFVRQINNFVSHFEQKGRDRENRRKLIMSLYESLLLDVGSKDTTKFIDFFFKKAMILLNENLSRNKAYDKLSIEKAIWKTHLIGQILITTLELDTLMDHITQLLPLLGIKSCYLNFYVKERKSNPERFEIPKRSTLMCAYNTSGRIMIPEDGIEFDTLDLMPQEIFFKAGRRSYIFTALFFGKEQLGFMLFEYGPRIELVYESLRKNISSAIKACLLFKEQELIKKKLLVANYNLHDEIKQHIVTEKKLEEASKAKVSFLPI